MRALSVNYENMNHTKNENDVLPEPEGYRYEGPKLSPTIKREAARQIDAGIMQARFALEYMKSQLAQIPAPSLNAPEAEQQAYAREKVKVDAQEASLEHQESYRAFIKQTFNV